MRTSGCRASVLRIDSSTFPFLVEIISRPPRAYRVGALCLLTLCLLQKTYFKGTANRCWWPISTRSTDGDLTRFIRRRMLGYECETIPGPSNEVFGPLSPGPSPSLSRRHVAIEQSVWFRLCPRRARTVAPHDSHTGPRLRNFCVGTGGAPRDGRYISVNDKRNVNITDLGLKRLESGIF
jgi:hypothetical protein